MDKKSIKDISRELSTWCSDNPWRRPGRPPPFPRQVGQGAPVLPQASQIPQAHGLFLGGGIAPNKADANGKGGGTSSTRRIARLSTSVTPATSRVKQGMTGEDALAKYRDVFSYSKNRLARTDRRELVRQLLDHPQADRRTPASASTAGAGGVGDALCLLNPFASIGLGRELQPPPAAAHRGAPQQQRAAPPQRPPPPPSIAPLHVTALVLPPPVPAAARRRPTATTSTSRTTAGPATGTGRKP